MQRLLLSLVVSTAFLGLAMEAYAHAALKKSEPAAGSKIRAAPAEVRLRFSEKVEPGFSRVRVLDAAGHEVDKKDTHAEKSDPAALAVSLPTLKAGHYKVVWKAVSVDTHVTKGNFTFDVQ